jgi:hypothetical protein
MKRQPRGIKRIVIGTEVTLSPVTLTQLELQEYAKDLALGHNPRVDYAGDFTDIEWEPYLKGFKYVF